MEIIITVKDLIRMIFQLIKSLNVSFMTIDCIKYVYFIDVIL